MQMDFYFMPNQHTRGDLKKLARAVSVGIWSCRSVAVSSVIGGEAEAGEERSCSQSAEQCRWRALSMIAGSS